MKNRIIFMVQMILNLVLLLVLIMTGIPGRDVQAGTTVTSLGYGKIAKVREAEAETASKVEAGEKTEKETEAETQDSIAGVNALVDAVKNRYSYAVVAKMLEDAIAETGEETEYVAALTVVPMVSIPEDAEKEERINRMMLERYRQCLPPVTEEAWWGVARPRITYRSERYLCFHYMPSPYIPGESDYGKLYFTLDLENESWVEYPSILDNSGEERYGVGSGWYGSLYREMVEYRKKTAEEQDSLQKETGYRVYGRETECDGITFTCAAIEGMEDSEKQEHINELLLEPLCTLILCPGWKEEDMEERNRVFPGVKTYIAYKSEKWLSIVYGIRLKTVENYNGDNDGMAKIGITIDLESGERVMLDDLFEIQKLLDWMYAEYVYREEDRYYRATLGSVLTEKEILDWYQEKYGQASDGYRALDAYNNGLIDSFYLHEGKLVILQGIEARDVEIPLPEVYECLKVDPWYD